MVFVTTYIIMDESEGVKSLFSYQCAFFRSVLFDLVIILYIMGTHISRCNIAQNIGTIIMRFLCIVMGTISMYFIFDLWYNILLHLI